MDRWTGLTALKFNLNLLPILIAKTPRRGFLQTFANAQSSEHSITV